MLVFTNLPVISVVFLEDPMSVLVLATSTDTSCLDGPKSVLCLLLHHVYLFLSGGSQICYVPATAPRLPVSVWRVPNLFLCLLLHHVCLCLSGWSQICFCACYCTTSICCPSGGSQICSFLTFLFESISFILDIYVSV